MRVSKQTTVKRLDKRSWNSYSAGNANRKALAKFDPGWFDQSTQQEMLLFASNVSPLKSLI